MSNYTKRFLIDNSDAIGLSPSHKDEEIWRIFNERMFESIEYGQILDSFYTRRSIRERGKVDIKALRQKIKAECSPHLGEICRSDSRIIVYERKIRSLIISTEIEFGGRSAIRYTHCLLYEHPNSSERDFIFLTDFLRWIGIGGLDWEFMTHTDITYVASTLRELTHNFMRGAENIIS